MRFYGRWLANIFRQLWIAVRFLPPGTRVKLRAPEDPVDAGVWVIEEIHAAPFAGPWATLYFLKRPDGPLGQRLLQGHHQVRRV